MPTFTTFEWALLGGFGALILSVWWLIAVASSLEERARRISADIGSVHASLTSIEDKLIDIVAMGAADRSTPD